MEPQGTGVLYTATGSCCCIALEASASRPRFQDLEIQENVLYVGKTGAESRDESLLFCCDFHPSRNGLIEQQSAIYTRKTLLRVEGNFCVVCVSQEYYEFYHTWRRRHDDRWMPPPVRLSGDARPQFCPQQYMMADKARLFNDDDHAHTRCRSCRSAFCARQIPSQPPHSVRCWTVLAITRTCSSLPLYRRHGQRRYQPVHPPLGMTAQYPLGQRRVSSIGNKTERSPFLRLAPVFPATHMTGRLPYLSWTTKSCHLGIHSYPWVDT